MTTWITTLWKDFDRLSKGEFGIKYIFPGLAIFFTWGVLAHLYDVNLNRQNLRPFSGPISSISVQYEQGTKDHYKYYPLKITLSNYDSSFRLMDVFSEDFEHLQRQLSNGDTITLYTRNPLTSYLTWGKRDDIYQIDKGTQTLFSLTTMQNYKKNQMKFVSLFCIACWTIYGFSKFKKKKRQPLTQASTYSG